MKNKKRGFFVLGLTGLFFLSFALLVRAENSNEYYRININKETIAKGYTVTVFEDELKLSLVPGILSESTDVEIVRLNEKLSLPWSLNLESRIYQFEFKNKEAYHDHNPFYIQFSYTGDSNDHKQVYFFDKNYSKWRPLPTRDFFEEKFVRSLIHLPYARIAVFSNPGKITSGRASWYGYKGGDFTASPDFPKGSVLRVSNNENDKYVDVTVNDWGPDRSIHPDRVVDLDKFAFAKLAPLSSGMIDVTVEPLSIEKDSNGFVLDVNPKGVGIEPEVSIRAGIIIEEESGKVVWGKNATSVLPIASLTKMVSIKIFLDTRPTLNNTVVYKYADEEYNYQYAKKWELARLKLEEGDVVTIEDLLYASLVGSANNTVETLVRASSLTRLDFIKKMNDSVVKWGASSSKFFEPTGLDPNNVSSAHDYAIISKEVLTHPIIAKASVMEEYKFTTINTDKSFRVRNTNKIISRDHFNISGSKTGYLNEALYCLMTRVEADKKIIVITLGASSRDISFHETSQLIKFGLRQ